MSLPPATSGTSVPSGTPSPRPAADRSPDLGVVAGMTWGWVGERGTWTGPEADASLEAMAALVDDQTVLVVGSAPCYPFWVIDPIPALAAMAATHGIESYLRRLGAALGWPEDAVS